MAMQQQLQGNWHEIKGAVKKKWGQVTDQDLTSAEGDAERLVGIIQRKTGEARDAIERFLDNLGPEAKSAVGQAANTVREYAEVAGQQVSQAYEQVSERVHRGYEAAEQHVRENPAQSLAVAFGAGVLMGVIVGAMLRSR
jgi:uncharacterized protein YjbJ (UPF0337 family)